jgi:hypothetical protein
MIDLLGHKFEDYTINIIDNRFKYHKCINCNIIIYEYQSCYFMSLENISFKLSSPEVRPLDMTCEEVIIKNIIE